MNTPSLKLRVLQRALQLAGNERMLARQLRVPLPDLFLWLKGDDVPPQSVFLRAVDLLSEQGAFGSAPLPVPNEGTAGEHALR